MRKYFYIDKRLALELNGAQTRNILYGMECVLSELDRNELSTSTLLLAANRENSLLKANIIRSYSAYGFDDLTSRESLIGFNGETRDAVVGCDLLGNGRRAYSPVLMRFLSPDIMSPFEEGGLNAYMYCEGDPINYSDPSAMVRGANNKSPSPPHTVPKGSKSNTISRTNFPQQSGAAASGGSDGAPRSSGRAKRRPDAPAVEKQLWIELNAGLKLNPNMTPRSVATYMVRNYHTGSRTNGFSSARLIDGIEYKIIYEGADFTEANGWVFTGSAEPNDRKSKQTSLTQAINRVVYRNHLEYMVRMISSASSKSHAVRKNQQSVTPSEKT